MARYTVQMRQLTIEKGWTDEKLGLSNYPIFDPEYREHLNRLIRDHYAFEEIGFETPARFAWMLDVRMREIMPYFNRLYEAMLQDFDPLTNVDVRYEGLSNVIENIINSAVKDSDTVNKGQTSSGTVGTDNSKSNEQDDSNNITTDVTSGTTSGTSKDTASTSNVSAVNGRTENSGKDTITHEHGQHITHSGGYSDNYDYYDAIDGSEDTIYGKGVKTTYNTDVKVTGKTVEADPPNSALTISEINNNNYASKVVMDNNETKKTGYDEEKSSGKDTLQYNDRKNTRKGFTRRDYAQDKQQYGGKDTDTNEAGKNVDTNSTDISNGTAVNDAKTDTTTSDTRAASAHADSRREQNTDRVYTSNVLSDDSRNVIEKLSELAQHFGDTHKNDAWTKKGREGITVGQILAELQEQLVSVDALVVDALKDLFICILN